uniref:Uncharacterized protein n=1 Tax=Lepeophtheirus salmonis TaxID=72036 RepID=A0A0K2UIM4_LEPSM
MVSNLFQFFLNPLKIASKQFFRAVSKTVKRQYFYSREPTIYFQHPPSFKKQLNRHILLD